MILFTSFHFILVAAAVIPAIALLIYVYKEDRLEKEPPQMIIKLVFMGIISTLLAAFTERIGMSILGSMFSENSFMYRALLYFVVVAFSEEGFKFLVLKWGSWRSPEFNCKFDGVVYAVAVSLGFALWENIQYVLSYGFSTALVRAVTAVPGHACFGVLMGGWYGLAKRKEVQGWMNASRLARVFAVVFPALVHGAYDFIATNESSAGTLAFIVFVVIMFVICFYTVRRLSTEDKYLEEE